MAASLMTAQASWLLLACALATAFSVLLARVFTGRRQQQWLWRVTRVCPGIYRRRRCPCVILSSFRTEHTRDQCTTRPAVHMQSRKTLSRCSLKDLPIQAPFFLVVVVFLVHLADAAPKVPQPAMHTLPTLRPYGQQAQQITASCKRSFKRAQRRALRDGTTGYRGRLHTPSSLGLQHLRPNTRQTLTHASSQDPQFRLVTWNAGGLNALRYTELLGWLQQERDAGRPVHIMCVQETKWPYNAEYSNKHWFFIHSGMTQSQGGILFIVSREIATQDQIRHAPLVEGRALHLRVALHPPLDILGVYQYAWSLPNALQPEGPYV